MQVSERSEEGLLADGDADGEGLEVCGSGPAHRRWPEREKARIVLESLAPGVRVCDVARRNGVAPRRLSEWRNLARRGELALPSSVQPAFAALEVEDVPGSVGSVAIEAGGVTVRIGGDSTVARIGEIAAALRGLR